MAFNWLNKFHKQMEKSADYAEKTLASYRLGMKAKGSIVGVNILTAPQSCAAACALEEGAIYHPDDAPHVPLANCPNAATCPCVYRPVMSYQVKKDE
ncbi:MAG: hypothetical protein ACPG8W_10440 [Candidatus Promineifilaceae bacterium]